MYSNGSWTVGVFGRFEWAALAFIFFQTGPIRVFGRLVNRFVRKFEVCINIVSYGFSIFLEAKLVANNMGWYRHQGVKVNAEKLR
jgi:hypothetical protein